MASLLGVSHHRGILGGREVELALTRSDPIHTTSPLQDGAQIMGGLARTGLSVAGILRPEVFTVAFAVIADRQAGGSSLLPLHPDFPVFFCLDLGVAVSSLREAAVVVIG